MQFKSWFLINENIEQNFDLWLKSIIRYEKPHESNILRQLGLYYGEPPKDYKLLDKTGDIVHEFNNRLKNFKNIIIQVLKNKNIENLNWLSFSIGFLAVKSFAQEDLELAIDVTKKRIDNGELPKSEIGLKGWMQVGKESLAHVKKYLADQQELSNRQKLKLKKTGETVEEDKNLIRTVGQDERYTLYYLPSLEVHPDNVEGMYNQITSQSIKEKIESRKRLLCKYGKGTDWCTANPSGDYDTYYLNNSIYILHEYDKPKYQFTSCEDAIRAGSSSNQFMDVKDNSVSKLSVEEKRFLDKYAKKAYACYPMKIEFSDLKSYLEASPEEKENISPQSLIKLVEDKDFNKLPEKEVSMMLRELSHDITAQTWIRIIDKISEEHLNNSLKGKLLLNLIAQIQYYDYDGLIKKLRKDSFNKFLDLTMNDLYDEEDDPEYAMEVQASRKKTIRKLLDNGHSIDNSLKILDFIIKKATIGLPEAYTIFDVIISKIKQYSDEGLISTPTAMSSLDKFARIFGKENINRIDLDRFKDRMKVEFIPDGNGTYKAKVDQQSLHSIKNLMIRFLVRYHDKITGTDRAQDWFSSDLRNKKGFYY